MAQKTTLFAKMFREAREKGKKPDPQAIQNANYVKRNAVHKQINGWSLITT